jgi:hypothetical protein
MLTIPYAIWFGAALVSILLLASAFYYAYYCNKSDQCKTG